MKACMTCEKVEEVCSREQINACLRDCECEHCDSPHWNYPYGNDESRHCAECGAEWPVWK